MKKKILIILVFLLCLTGCKSSKPLHPTEEEHEKLLKEALKYMSNKYNIDASDITVTYNYLYTPGSSYMGDYNENMAKIEFNGKKCEIHYDSIYGNGYLDDCQYDEIVHDYRYYFLNKYQFLSYANTDPTTTSRIYYDGDIKSYVKKVIEEDIRLSGNKYSNGFSISLKGKVDNEVKAKELYNSEEFKLFLDDLHSFDANFDVYLLDEIKPNIDYNQGVTKFYEIRKKTGYIYIYDKIDNKNTKCTYNNFIDGICKNK